MKPHSYVLALLVACCLLFACSCSTLSKVGAGKFVVVIDAQAGDSHPAHGRTTGDGNMLLYRADDVAITLRVLNSDGYTVIERRVEAGKVGLVDRSRDYRKSFAPGEKLPLWALAPLFPDGGRAMARNYGFEFEADPVNP